MVESAKIIPFPDHPLRKKQEQPKTEIDNDNLKEPKYRRTEKVLINGRQGEVYMRGYDHLNNSESTAKADDYLIFFYNNGNPKYQWVKEKDINLIND